MKKLLIICVVTIICSSTFAQNSIQFEQSNWNQILEKAKKENKLVFLDAYAEWCGPCKWMAKNTFTDPKVADYYNTHFINAKIDMEKGEGVELAQKYNVRAYPSLLYISPDGSLVHRMCGAADPVAFIKWGETAMDEQNNFRSYEKKFDEGEVDAEFMNEYAKLLQSACLPPGEAVGKYLSRMPEEKLMEEPNWKLMQSYMNDYDSKAFQYVLNNRTQFEKKYGKKEVNEKIFDVYQYGLFAYEARNDMKGMDDLKKKIRTTGHPDAERVIAMAELKAYERKKDWDQYAKTADKYTRNYAWNDANELNNIAWKFYENIDDKKMLKLALPIAQRSMELDKRYYNTDTYASLLYKLGNKSEAATAAQEAIKIAKENNEDYTETEKLLEKINNH